MFLLSGKRRHRINPKPASSENPQGRVFFYLSRRFQSVARDG
jgi:hypothetical protein